MAGAAELKGSLSAAAAPYVPSTTAQGGYSAGAPVLELAVALDPDSQSYIGHGPGHLAGNTSHNGSAGIYEDGYGKAYWVAAGRREARAPGPIGAETPKARKRDYSLGGRASMDETPSKAARASIQLRALLDFYFENFNLQHNRYLLDLIARRMGPPKKPGPWPAQLLVDFRFTFDDLMGLGRIASALAKIKLSPYSDDPPWRRYQALGQLKHLRWTGDGKLQLRSPPEVRSFVPARNVSAEAVRDAVRYLSGVREQRGQVPSGMLSALSYAMADTLADSSQKGVQRRAQLKRQLLLHHTDIMCLHGFDPHGHGLTQTLVEEGYNFSWARSDRGEANAIFWDRSRFELQSHDEFGAALAIDLRSLEDGSKLFRAICMRPPVPTSSCTGLSRLFAGRAKGGPLIACVDFTLLGGAESAAIVEELASMSSLPREVLGDELAAPLAESNPQDGSAEPIRAGASGLNRIHRPDSMLYEGFAPLLALSGHSEYHLETMAPEDVVQQFPAFRIPIVAAFHWDAVGKEAMEEETSSGGNSGTFSWRIPSSSSSRTSGTPPGRASASDVRAN